MKIALDYDLTYTLDPNAWRQTIDIMRSLGHDVRIVTARDDRFDRTAGLVAAEKVVPVIYCRGIAKRWFCSHFTDGFVPDVWIDDKPEGVLANSTGTPEGLTQWRAERNEGPTLPVVELPPCPVCGLTTPHHPDHELG